MSAGGRNLYSVHFYFLSSCTHTDDLIGLLAPVPVRRPVLSFYETCRGPSIWRIFPANENTGAPMSESHRQTCPPPVVCRESIGRPTIALCLDSDSSYANLWAPHAYNLPTQPLDLNSMSPSNPDEYSIERVHHCGTDSRTITAAIQHTHKENAQYYFTQQIELGKCSPSEVCRRQGIFAHCVSP